MGGSRRYGSTLRMRVARSMALLVGLSVLGMAFPAAAQVVLMTPSSDLYEWEYKPRFDVSNQFRTDIDGGGSFSRLRYDAGFGIAGPLSKAIRVRLDFDYAHDKYDFGGSSTAGCSDPAACFEGRPWERINTVDLSAGGALVVNEGISIVAIVPMRWAFERDADELTISAGITGGLRLRLGERFVTTVGVGIQSEIEDDMSVFPLVTLDWQMTDNLRIVTRGDAYQGGDAALVWGPSDAFQALVSSGFTRERFRLDDGSPNSDGVGEYQAVPVTIGFKLNIAERTHIGVEGGVAVAGRLRIEDNNGNALRVEDFSTAGIISGGLHVMF